MKDFPVQPLGDRVIVRRETPEKVTKSGIIIPDSAEDKKKMQGTVVAVGPGKRSRDGELIPAPVSVGDEVLFENDWRDPVEIDGDEYMVLSSESLIGILKK